MEKYVQDIRLQQWSELINSANKSGLSRKEWLEQNGISKDAFYYWQRKVRKYYAERKGLLPAVQEASTGKLVEVPVARVAMSPLQMSAAVIRIGNLSVEVSPNASAEFMENLGRMIRNAL